MTKKILLITNIFPPDIGGPATFIDALGSALHAQGHDVTVICTSEQPKEASDAQRPYKLQRLRRHAHPLRLLQWVAVMGYQLLRHRIILVNGLEYQTAKLAQWLRRDFILKIVGDSTWETGRNDGEILLSIDDFQNAPVPKALADMRRKHMYFVNRAARIIVPSQYMNGLVSKWTNKRVHTILNGSKLENYSPYQPSQRAEGETFHLAFIGRLTNWKGVETALLAMVHLPNAHLHIFGTGPEMPILFDLSNQLRLTNVTFEGKVTGKDLRDRLSTMHALVLTSSYEGLSHTLIEMCAMGIPCITSNCGGNPEVITDGEQGFVIPYGDVSALRSAVEKLFDETLRQRMAVSAKAQAQNFTFDATVKNTVAYLLQDA